jgi:NitT/TauT family transport system substrate-binding protein
VTAKNVAWPGHNQKSEYLAQRRKGRKEIKLPDLAFLASWREQIPVLDCHRPLAKTLMYSSAKSCATPSIKAGVKKTGILLFWILNSLAVVIVHPSPLPAQEKSLYVLYSGINANYLSLWLAKDARYFADEGLNVQAVHVRGAAPVVQNLMAGQSQLGMIGATVVATAAIQGNKDLVMIGGVTNVMAFAVAARPGIESPQAIKGKKLAVARLGGTTDFVVDYALKQWKMQRNDISILQIGNEADRLAAMKAGQIDLSVFTPTYLPVIEKAGMKVLLDLEKLGVPYALNGYASTRSYIAKNRPTVVGFMRGVIKAIRRIKSDREFSRKILEKYVRIDDPQFINAALDQQVRILPDPPYPPVKGIETILQELARTYPEASKMTPESIIDSTIVKDASP